LAALLFVARAQQLKLPVIGFLSSGSPGHSDISFSRSVEEVFSTSPPH
jgi:hypothetical protein